MRTTRKPGRKPALLNVRQHLEHLQLVLDYIDKYGIDAPIIQGELRKLSLINRNILRKHDERRARGRRKDLLQ